MRCADLERWLDEGMPAGRSAAARAHAGSCPRCAGALRAAVELDSLLVTAPVAAPADFADRVMARLGSAAAEPDAAPGVLAARVSPEDAFIWWARAAAEPATALALAVAGILAWPGSRAAMVEFFAAAPASILGYLVAPTSWAADLAASLLSVFSRHESAAPWLTLGLLALTGWASLALYRWSQSLALVPSARLRGR